MNGLIGFLRFDCCMSNAHTFRIVVLIFDVCVGILLIVIILILEVIVLNKQTILLLLEHRPS